MQNSQLPSHFSTLKKHYQHLLSPKQKPLAFFAPGRVNLIGEYTDFNGGLVLPCAIQNGTYLMLQARTDDNFHFYSINCPETPRINLTQLLATQTKQKNYAWANYPLGILKQFENKLSTGFDFFYYGNIPLGSGLSSSASIEMVTAFALNTLCKTNNSLTDLALLCQRAENQFIGLQCGIMDMYSIAHGKANHALMINCESLSHVDSKLDMGEYAWLIVNSNKMRQLSESKYNERHQECQQALSILNLTRQLDNLCQLPVTELTQAKKEISDNTLYKRLMHVVSEHQRVIDCHLAIHNKQWKTVAELMNASHQSLSQNFAVSGEILDTLVDISQKTPGVLGARMTGAGFGGCIILLIQKEQEARIIENIQKKYLSDTTRQADFYSVCAAQGVHQFMQDINE